MGLDLYLVKKVSDKHRVIPTKWGSYQLYPDEAFERIYDEDFGDDRFTEDDDIVFVWIHGLGDNREHAVVDEICSYERPQDLPAARKALDEAVYTRDGKRRSYVLMKLFEDHPDYYLGSSH